MHIVLYKPDIPQNTAAIIRLGACLKLKIHIIEPCNKKLEETIKNGSTFIPYSLDTVMLHYNKPNS